MLEQEYRAREADLRAREAELSTHEAEMAHARAALQETIREASERHCGEEAVIALKMRELTCLREETGIDITGLDAYRAKIRAMEGRLDAKSATLAHREASSTEAATKL